MRHVWALMFSFLLPLAITLAQAEPPHFLVVTADGSTLSDAQLRSRALILWYDSSDTVHLNDEAKTELSRVLATLPEATRPRLVAVGDVSRYDYWPARRFAQSELRKFEGIYHIAIYGDWTGAIRTALTLAEGQSNLLFVSATGEVRFRGTGKLPHADVQRVIELSRAIP
ncbi:MAG: hypothetical protein JWN04_1397 [Myxococcaceae bacterium]|nr:hypothetical protein [Myxococcaceae bacterium]